MSPPPPVVARSAPLSMGAPPPSSGPSISLSSHACTPNILQQKKKEGEREREEQSRCEHTTRTHAHNHSRRWATSTSRTSVRSPRPGVSRQLSPGKKKTTTTTTKAPALRGSGEAGRSPPSLSSSPPFGFAPPAPEASCLPVPFFCSHDNCPGGGYDLSLSEALACRPCFE